MSSVRTFEQHDIPQVVALAWRFLHGDSDSARLLVYSRNPELARQIQSGSAFLTRLDGEWCLKFGTPAPATRRGAIR
jgi:hypothetical protein